MQDDYAHKRLSRYYKTFLEAALAAFRKYNECQYTDIQRRTTQANDINDLWFAELVNGLDEFGIAPVFDTRRGLRFLKVPGRIPIHLWLKKANRSRRTKNYPTEHARRMESGQAEMFPSAVMLTLSYLPKPDMTGFVRISITPPLGRIGKLEWAIDLSVQDNVRSMSAVSDGGQAEVKVTRFSQRKLEA